MLLVAGRIQNSARHAESGLQDALGTERWQTADGSADTREALDDQVHPGEAVDDHQVDEATAQYVLDHAAEEKGRIELAFGAVLDPGNDDVDQEQREKQLERVGLDGSTVVNPSVVELSGYSVKIQADS